jgi:MscS family membrane protein
VNMSVRQLAALLVFLFVPIAWGRLALASPSSPIGPARPTSSPSANASPGSVPNAGVAPNASSAVEEKVAADSPRAAMAEFRRLTRTQDFAGAARYLDLSSVDQADGPILAQHLREVLSRHLWIDLDKISSNSRGNPDDAPGANQQLLGSVPGPTGQLEPVELVRKSYGPGTHWVFSAGTVAKIEGWYDHLGNLWLVERIPKPLLRMGPQHLRRWQWLALLPLTLGAWLTAFAVTRVLRTVFRKLLSERGAESLHKLHGAATLACAVAASYAFLPWLGLYEPAEAMVERWLASGLLLAAFWAVWRAIELSQRTVGKTRWARESLTAHSLLLLGARLAKFGIAAVAVIVVLAELGYHATSLITGLGIGGIALALAAQKTVENLFGAFSLAIDQPFREGDTIQVDTIGGTVEAIGLRSTRIRTADRTVISIPNGKLADMRVETISRQDRLRFYCLIGVAHGQAADLEKIVSAVDDLLHSEASVAQETIGVHFVSLSDSGLNLEVAAMFNTMDGNRVASARQALLLGIVAGIQKTGGALSHPMRRVELLRADDREGALEPESGPRFQTALPLAASADGSKRN